jgi:DNA-directed RNA polymerase specialized sigma subunit
MRDKDYTDGMTQQQIADVLGVSRNAIQQMERNIIIKIQRAFKRRGIKKEDYLGGMK